MGRREEEGAEEGQTAGAGDRGALAPCRHQSAARSGQQRGERYKCLKMVVRPLQCDTDSPTVNINRRIA